MARLMVVDDEQAICWGLSRLGRSLGHEVVTAASAEEALQRIPDFKPDVMLLDIRLPGIDGLTAIGKIRALAGDLPIIVMTAFGDLDTAVEAVRVGAFEYLVKPFELGPVEHVLARALEQLSEQRRLEQQNKPAGSDAEPPEGDGLRGLVGRTPAMQHVFGRIALAANSDANVLLHGESGTGKELAARAIHQYSRRADGPFVAVNVASLSPSLAESELFGHARGAFTGADHPRVGLLVQADGGVLFLDEVADIPLGVQVKLLRALEHGEVTPVGSTQAVRTDFRVVSATHQPLRECVGRGTFRHDLYFRLAAFEIEMPPLRERLDDIPELARHFIRQLAQPTPSAPGRPATPPPRISPAAVDELRRRPWYGNVRELRNAIEHAMIVARGGMILPEQLPPPVAFPTSAANDSPESIEAAIGRLLSRWTANQLADLQASGQLYERLLKLVEPPVFNAVLEQHQDQVAAAARILGLHRTTLKKKLDQHLEDNPR